LDSTNRLLLDHLQRAFPLVSAPYRKLAEKLGCGEREVLDRGRDLKGQGLVRQISAIFYTGGLGYRSSLVAMAVPEPELERAARVVNAYPGVSHNYLRPGQFNMWFTIAVPPGAVLDRVVARIAAAAGGHPALVLPAVKKYKLAVVLDVLDDQDPDNGLESAELPQTEASVRFDPSPHNIRLVRCVQEDLATSERPFQEWAEQLGMTEPELLDLLRTWMDQGLIRRFAAVLNHRQAGFRANGMVVWHCPPEQIDQLGERLAAYPEVSHCYRRPVHPQWPYNLYAMIHGRHADECRSVAERLNRAIGRDDYRILFSTREFKKIRLKLFWDEPSGCCC